MLFMYALLMDLGFDCDVRLVSRTNNVPIGYFMFTINGDDFNLASTASPIYVELKFNNNVTLSETLAQGSEISLALRLTQMKNNFNVVAPTCSLQIVRAISGEPSIWLRIQSASDTWLENVIFGSLEPPNVNAPVDWVFGIDEQESALIYSALYDFGLANLPFNQINSSCMTDPTFATPISTKIYLDLAQSSLTEGDLLTFSTWVGRASGVETASNPSGISKTSVIPVNILGNKWVAVIETTTCQ